MSDCGRLMEFSSGVVAGELIVAKALRIFTCLGGIPQVPSDCHGDWIKSPT